MYEHDDLVDSNFPHPKDSVRMSANWSEDKKPGKPQPGGENPHNSPDIKTIRLPELLPTGWPGGSPSIQPGRLE
jgi:hypothetical protein